MIVLLDNGHGANTPGKRSPDGRLFEYAYAREIARRIESRLDEEGINCKRIVPEETDVNLNERVRRANAVCREQGADNVLLVSIHVNAAGDGSRWLKARGWQACLSANASEASKRLARTLYEAAGAEGLKLRRYISREPWFVQNLAICRDTLCPAVLTENLFMDSREDVNYLLGEAGRQAIASLHVKGIMDYIDDATR